MNRTPWVLQRRIPMHWLTGVVIHLGSKGWLCRTGLFGPAAMYIWVLHCSSRQQPPRQPGPDPSHDFGCTGAPPAACHALSNMEISALSGQAALNEFNFAQVIVLPEKISQQLQHDHLPLCAATEPQRSCDLSTATGRRRAEEGEHSRPELQQRPEMASKPLSHHQPLLQRKKLNCKLLGVTASFSVYP